MEQHPPIHDPHLGPVTGDERTLAVLAHALTLVGGFIVPLIIWLVKKEESVFVRESAKESLNFQITLYIVLMACALLLIVLIGAFLMPVVGVVGFVLVVIASIRTSEGQLYRYPINFRLIK